MITVHFEFRQGLLSINLCVYILISEYQMCAENKKSVCLFF